MEDEIEIFNNKNENPPKAVQLEIKNVSIAAIVIAVSLAVISDILAALFYYFFQGIDAGCGTQCESIGFIYVVIVYYLSVACSILLIKKKPIAVGIYIFIASLASLVLNNIIFGIIPFVILFALGAKILEHSWKKIDGSEKTKQILLGLMFSVAAVLLSVFHFFAHMI